MKTITKLGLAVTLLFLVSFFTQANAQSHDVKARNCKYYKKPPNPGSGAEVTDFSVCKVCSEKKKKEDDAKRAEDQRRTDIAIAKQKADNERKAKEIAERLQAEAAEKKRKEENIARAKKESEDALKRASEIRNKYKQLSNIKGEEHEEEIAGLEAHNDREYFGVKLNGDFLWRKPTDNLPISTSKIYGTNYFVAYNGSKGKVYNLYGKPILIDGEEWFNQVSFNKEKKIFEFKMFDGKPIQVSSEILCYYSSEYIPFEGIYNSISEIKAIYEENLKIADAIRKKRLAESGGKGGTVMCVHSSTPLAIRGRYIATDAKLKILKNQTGYFAK